MNEGKPGASKGLIALFAASTATFVAVLAAGVFWLVPTLQEINSSESLSYDLLPTPQAAALVSESRSSIALVPLDLGQDAQAGSVVANSEGLTVFAAVIDGENALVAMDEVATGRPVWVRQIEGSATECSVVSRAIDCGAVGTFDLLTGEDASDDKPEGQEEETKNPKAAEGQVGLGKTFHAKKAPTAADAAFHVTNGDLVTTKGETVATFSSGEAWVVSSPDAKTDVFTDGEQIIATEGSQVAWEKTLPEGSLSVNVVGESCALAAGDTALVAGTPESIVGFDLKTGAELWQVEVSVESWLLSGSILLVASDGDVHLLSFTDTGRSSHRDEGGDEPRETEGTDRDDSSGTHLKLWATDLPTAPTYDDMANEMLSLPEGFGEYLNSPSGDRVQMRDGWYEGTQEKAAGFVGLHEVTPLYINEDAFAVALMDYGLRGTDDSGGMWVIYDSDLQPVDSHALGDAGGFAWFDIHGSFNAGSKLNAWFLPTVGSTFTYEFETWSHTSDTNTGRISWKFNGQKATFERFEIDVSPGVSRHPNQELLQQIRDDLSAGRDEAAAPYLSDEALDQVQNGHVSEGRTPETMLRGLAFPAGGTVEQCVLVHSSFHPDYMITDSNGVHLGYPNDMSAVTAQELETEGTWYCGLKDGDVPEVGGVPVYSDFLVVTTDREGNPRIERLDRIYS